MRKTLEQTVQRFIFHDDRLSRTARLVYFGLWGTRRGTVAESTRALEMPRETVRRSVQQLLVHDWMYCFRRSDGGRVYVPWMPAGVQKVAARRAKQLLDIAAPRGETLMKAWLDIIVNDLHYQDNPRPPWLVSSDSGQRLELDRIYVDANVAIEFQGRQHFESVSFHDGQRDLANQMMRDALKALACRRREIAFVEITAMDLSYDALRTKLEGLLPLVPPDMGGPVCKFLAAECDAYVNWALSRRRSVLT